MLPLLFALLLVTVFFFLPVRAQITASFDGRFQMHASISVAGISLPVSRFPASGKAPSPPLLPHTLRLVRECLFSYRVLLRRFSVRHLRLQASIAASTPARTALLTGALGGICRLLPSLWLKDASIAIAPDFLGSAVKARLECMVCVHLGILVYTAILLRARLSRMPGMD